MKKHVILLSLFIKCSVFASSFDCETGRAPHYRVTTTQGKVNIRLGIENSPQNICILTTMKRIQAVLCSIPALTDHLDSTSNLSVEFQYVGNEDFKKHIDKHFKSLGLKNPIIGHYNGSSCLNLSYQELTFPKFMQSVAPASLNSKNFQTAYSIVEERCISAFPGDMKQLGAFFCLLNRVILAGEARQLHGNGVYARLQYEPSRCKRSPDKIAALVWIPVDQGRGVEFVIKFDILKGSFDKQSYTIQNTGTLLTIYPTTYRQFEQRGGVLVIKKYNSGIAIYLEELKKLKLAFPPEEFQGSYDKLFDALFSEVDSSIVAEFSPTKDKNLSPSHKFLLDQYLDVYFDFLLRGGIHDKVMEHFQHILRKVNTLRNTRGITPGKTVDICYFMECIIPSYYNKICINYDSGMLLFSRIREILNGYTEEKKSTIMAERLQTFTRHVFLNNNFQTGGESLKVLAIGKTLPEKVSEQLCKNWSKQLEEIRKQKCLKKSSVFYCKVLQSMLDGFKEGWSLYNLEFPRNQLSGSELQHLNQLKEEMLAAMLMELQKEKEFKNLKTIDDYFMISMTPKELLWRAVFFTRLYYNVLKLDDSGLIEYIEECVKQFISFTPERQKHYPKYTEKTTQLLGAGGLLIFSYAKEE